MTKKNIILIHGWGARADKLLPLEKCLTVLGWSVKKIKLPGFDLANPLTSWGMQEYADYVLAKIKKYLPANIVLLSQGEIVAESLSDYLKRHPEMEQKCSKGGSVVFFTTDSPAIFDAAAMSFFGKAAKSIHLAL